MRILLLVTLALLVMALVCLLAPTTIAGAGWAVWLVAAGIAYVLDALIGARLTTTRVGNA